MKLYTEYHLKEVYFKGWNDCLHNNNGGIHNAIDFQTPIVLPSDDEIEEEMPKRFFGLEKEGFLAGAIWMKTKILNQNK